MTAGPILRRSLALLLLATACGRTGQRLRDTVSHAGQPAGPQIAATVVVVRTSMQPQNKVTRTTLIIGRDAARATEEDGLWHLYDFKENRIAFVNDFARTYRYETLQALREQHRDAGAEALDERSAPAQYAATGAQRDILGVRTTESAVTLGGYRRQIWFGQHPLIPPQLFSLMQSARTPGPEAAATRKIDEAFFAVKGFPMADHTELLFGQSRMIVDRDVAAVDRRSVSAALLEIPDGYRQVRQAPARPAPAVPRRPSPPADTTASPVTPAPTTGTSLPVSSIPAPASPVERGTASEDLPAAALAKREAPEKNAAAPDKKSVTSKKKPVATSKKTAPPKKTIAPKKTTPKKKTTTPKKTVPLKKGALVPRASPQTKQGSSGEFAGPSESSGATRQEPAG